ncbi:unnamed protein product [Bursaphelenchus okinawaensis]|uniref:Uncharacterized protein n=1 Tax=Bursaphelenchus okinawaensis TaxID=465554 RepID=A0A811L546_9BILA|nr:unnamed protein product [Bursaphelenchus okinawaensis]CAG9116889.1 unnamed protein product [Bursaphelenchus okinawaensis]
MILTWILFIFGALIGVANGQQAYCWDPCTYNCPNRAPRLCPNEGIMTYYDCCQDGCCEFIKWPNLIFLVCIIFALLCGCGCCCFFLITDAQRRYKDEDAKRSRRWTKSQRRKDPHELDVSTIDSSRSPRAPPPPPRYYEHRRSTVV